MSMVRNTIRYVVGATYKPLLTRYLSKTRTYRYGDISLLVPPEVFHPGFYDSTQLLLQFVRKFPLKNCRLLEPGAGSGLISIYAAKQGADVTATDINATAIDYLGINARTNDVSLRIIHSDLFEQIPEQKFDIIAINPPYYKKQPQREAEFAWYCGENGEYFDSLFAGLKNYMHQSTKAFMILCDGCDIKMVEKFSDQYGFSLDIVFSKQTLIEKNFIYQIKIAE